MREIDRGIYTNLENNYIVGIINNLHTFIADFKSGTLTLRILDDIAKLYVNVVSKQGYRRVYDFEADLEIAQIFISAYENDTNKKIYRYYVLYQDSVTHVYQYELGELSEPVITLQYLNNNVIKKNDQTVVVQHPVISGPNVITPFQSEKYVITSKILTEEDSLLSTFIVEFAGKTIQTFILPNTKYAEEICVLSLDNHNYRSGDVIELKVTAVDNELHYSSTAIKEIVVDAGVIKTPTILSPYSNNYINPNNIFIKVSDFTLIRAVDPKHISTDWKLTSDRKGKNIVYEGSFVGEETSFVLNFDNDLEEGTYFLFVRQEDQYIGYSEWSQPVQLVVDAKYVYEQVVPPYIQSVLWVNRGNSYTLNLSSSSKTEEKLRRLNINYDGYFEKVVAFKIYDYLTNSEVTIPSLAASIPNNIENRYEFEIADYTFTVPEESDFYFIDKKEYIISIKAIDEKGVESLYNYAFIRVLDNASSLSKKITIVEEVDYLMTDIIPSEYENYTFGSIYSPINCSVMEQDNSLKIRPTGLLGLPVNFVYTILSPDKKHEVYVYVDITVEKMPSINEYLFETDYEINSLLSSYSTPTQRDIFNKWTRFSNYNKVYKNHTTWTPTNDEASAWNLINNEIISEDSTTPIGFVSPDSYLYYTLDARLSSSDTDDDMLGIVLAFSTKNGIIRMLVAARNGAMQEQPPLPYIRNNFGLLYFEGNYVKVLRACPIVTTNLYQSWSLNSFTKIYAKRINTKFIVKMSPFNSELYDDNTELVLDINNYLDNSEYTWMLEPSPYGFFAWSQKSAKFNITLSGEEGIETLYSIESNKLLKQEGDSYVEVPQTAQEYFGSPVLVTNNLTNKKFFILPELIRRVSDSELEERYSLWNIKHS